MRFEFKLPDIGEGVVEGEIVRWLVKTGEEVIEDAPLVEVMTDKATVEIPSPVSGTVLERRGKEGERIAVGETMVVIETASSLGLEAAAVEPRLEQKREIHEPPAPSVSQPGGPVLATPAVRSLAREMGVDLTTIAGSGPGGRITQEDVEREARTASPGRDQELEEEIPFRGIRKMIAQHLTRSIQTAVHYTYVEEVDASELVQLRSRLQDRSGEQAGRVTYLPFVVRAVVSGLKEYPLLNSTLDEKKGVLRIRKQYHIGIATATPEGLLVPVIHDADRFGVEELSGKIHSLTELARQGKARREELQGSTFTITSLGALGGLMATPVINYPEVGILAVHKIAKRPVVRNGEIAVREMMNLSLSLDHRVVDGAIGATFLRHVILLLEDPERLL